MWVHLNFALHIVWAIILSVTIFVMFKDYHFVDPALYDAVKDADSRDALHVAVQLGRLDLLNSVLAILSLVIAGGAIFGIIEVRKNAELKAIEAAIPAAEKASQPIAVEAATAAAEAQVRSLLPAIVRRYLEEASEENFRLGVNEETDADVQNLMNALDGLDKNGE